MTETWRTASSRQPAEGDDEQLITHIVPALELTGTREQKRRQIDDAVARLEQLRYRLMADFLDQPTAHSGRSHAETLTWPWLLVGVIVALVPLAALIVQAWW